MEPVKNDNKKEQSPEGLAANAKTKPNTVPGQETELLVITKERDECKEKYVRLYAEFENVRRRFEREKLEFVKYANEGLLVDFLGILDDLERSVEAAHAKHEDYSAFLKGIEMVMAHIYDLLKKNNVKPIESVGKKFDPHSQEVLMQGPSAEHPEGTVLEEFQKGYLLGDRVVRTAKVKVATAADSSESK